MKSIFKSFAYHFIRPVIQWYLSKTRTYHYKSISIKVLPGVFHPGFFFSTKFLLHYLDSVALSQKSLIELGAGSGLISFYAERKGAKVTASDLSSKAIENLLLNRAVLQSEIIIIKSDLFDDIPKQTFDFIVINPPYYSHSPESEEQLAWYCGENLEYFEKLFSQLKNYIHAASKIIMVLSEDCEMTQISIIGEKNRFVLNERIAKKFWFEWNYIFEIT